MSTIRTCFCCTEIRPSSWKREKARLTVSSLSPEIGADFLARHAQVEFRRRIAAGAEALRQVEQEGGQAFLGAHGAEQHHHAVVAHDFAAHDLVQVVLQGVNFAGKHFQFDERDQADFAVLQCDGIAGGAFRC
jgi:hypothetical protein